MIKVSFSLTKWNLNDAFTGMLVLRGKVFH